MEVTAIILFGIGLTTLMLQRNLIKKVIGFNIMDTAVCLFLAARGYITGRNAPIIVDGVTSVERYINPVPAGLILTGIVVGVSVTAVMLALCIKLHEYYGTLDMDKITMITKRKNE